MTVNSVLTGPTGTESLKGCISSVNPDLSYADAEKKFMAENRPSPLIYRQAGSSDRQMELRLLFALKAYDANPTRTP